MATHSSVLAWRILGTGEPGGLPSMGSHRVGHDWIDLAVAGELIWRRKWQPTPVFLPREFQGRGSLAGCRLWGCTVGHDWSDLAAAAAAAGELMNIRVYFLHFLTQTFYILTVNISIIGISLVFIYMWNSQFQLKNPT